MWTRGAELAHVARRSLVWRPAALAHEVTIDLAAVFRDIGSDREG
jgi:hypothetical protein